MSKQQINQFLQSLSIQTRVIKALIRREYITLSGKSGFGFLMLLGEPFVVMSFVMGFVSYSRLHTKTTFPIFDFVISGWGIQWICRYPLQRMGGAIIGNASFLYHKNIKVLDILISRSILMISAAMLSLSVIFVLYLMLFHTGEFYDILYILAALLYTLWYTLVICVFAGLLSAYTTLGDKVPILLSILQVFITGSFFMVTWIPETYRTAILALPLVNATEMMRYGFYGDKIRCIYSVPYMLFHVLCFTYITVRLVYIMPKKRSLQLE